MALNQTSRSGDNKIAAPAWAKSRTGRTGALAKPVRYNHLKMNNLYRLYR